MFDCGVVLTETLYTHSLELAEILSTSSGCQVQPARHSGLFGRIYSTAVGTRSAQTQSVGGMIEQPSRMGHRRSSARKMPLFYCMYVHTYHDSVHVIVPLNRVLRILRILLGGSNPRSCVRAAFPCFAVFLLPPPNDTESLEVPQARHDWEVSIVVHLSYELYVYSIL